MWGLHPALKDSMLPLWQKGQLAFVPFAGTEDLTRSHFETQDSMESGMPVSAPGSAPHAYGSGFLNRLAAALDATAAPVAFTDGLPMVMTGEIVVPNVSLKGTGRPRSTIDRWGCCRACMRARASRRSSRKASTCGRPSPSRPR